MSFLIGFHMTIDLWRAKRDELGWRVLRTLSGSKLREWMGIGSNLVKGIHGSHMNSTKKKKSKPQVFILSQSS